MNTTTKNATEKTLSDTHAAAAGALCADDGTGCCVACGVALEKCQDCTGVGYHRDGCPAMESL